MQSANYQKIQYHFWVSQNNYQINQNKQVKKYLQFKLNTMKNMNQNKNYMPKKYHPSNIIDTRKMIINFNDKLLNCQAKILWYQIANIILMKIQKYRKYLVAQQSSEQNFMGNLEQSLLTMKNPQNLTILQQVFTQKKQINQMLTKQKKLKFKADTEYLLAKKRVAQIQQLQQRTGRQAALLQTQIGKINDVLIMNKILMMEKLWKWKKEVDEQQRKKNLWKQRRGEKQKSTIDILSKKLDKLQKLRSTSLSTTLALKQQAQIKKISTIEQNRRKAQSVRLDDARRKSRLQQIEQFKRERAHKNYRQKIKSLNRTLNVRQLQLFSLAVNKQINTNNDLSAINPTIITNQNFQVLLPITKTN